MIIVVLVLLNQSTFDKDVHD